MRFQTLKILSIEEFEIEFNKILTHGDNDIILCNEDFDTNNKDLIVMSMTECDGSMTLQKAINLTIEDFEKENLSLLYTDTILVHFQVNSTCVMKEIAESMYIICDKCDPPHPIYDTSIIWGVSFDNDVKENYVKVTVFMSYEKKLLLQ